MITRHLTRHLIIHGRVQGVWFRESMRREAQRIGVHGWVRNRHNGSVEAVVCGAEEAVDQIIEWARSGPALARVERIDVAESSGSFTSFETLPTD